MEDLLILELMVMPMLLMIQDTCGYGHHRIGWMLDNLPVIQVVTDIPEVVLLVVLVL